MIKATDSSLKNNPLFLTLLCRYVKNHDFPPINDHDLLSGHIYRLAGRDEDYVRRKYGLTPNQLIEGTIQIAILFAEKPNLSLAPTQTEIAAELNINSLPSENLENMLAKEVELDALFNKTLFEKINYLLFYSCFILSLICGLIIILILLGLRAVGERLTLSFFK